MERAQLVAWLERMPEALAMRGRVLLADPSWTEPTRREAIRLTQLWGEREGAGCLALATGGTGGRLKLAVHSEATVAAAAAAFPLHFGIQRVNTVELLPAYHVSGLMSRLRARLSGGQSLSVDWRRLAAGEALSLPAKEDGWVLSLVPTQLQRLLTLPDGVVPWAAFRLLLLGGAPAWTGLLAEARRRRLPLCPSYGMTETAAMVAALTPPEFLAGGEGVGRPLPHARIQISTTGQVVIESPSLFLGYLGETPTEGPLTTADLGELSPDGLLRILGRADDVINTGGRKVSSSWLEGTLRDLGVTSDLAVVGVPDAAWGEAVVVCYAKGGNWPPLPRLREALAPHQWPKAWVPVDPWPRDARGKLNRSVLRDLATTAWRAGTSVSPG